MRRVATAACHGQHAAQNDPALGGQRLITGVLSPSRPSNVAYRPLAGPDSGCPSVERVQQFVNSIGEAPAPLGETTPFRSANEDRRSIRASVSTSRPGIPTSWPTLCARPNAAAPVKAYANGSLTFRSENFRKSRSFV